MFNINILHHSQRPFPYNKPGKDEGSSQFGEECTDPSFKTNILCAVR
jgi:hypothetical protein